MRSLIRRVINRLRPPQPTQAKKPAVLVVCTKADDIAVEAAASAVAESHGFSGVEIVYSVWTHTLPLALQEFAPVLIIGSGNIRQQSPSMNFTVSSTERLTQLANELGVSYVEVASNSEARS